MRLIPDDGQLEGVYTIRTSIRPTGPRGWLQGKNGKDVLVREVMTTPVVTIGPEVKILDAMQIMVTKKIRHLPILEKGEISGVVTLADLVRAVPADQEHTIDKLMKYVGHK